MTLVSAESERRAASVYEEVVQMQGLKYGRAETASLPLKQLFLTTSTNDLLDFSDRQYSQTVTVTSVTSASPAMPVDPRLRAWGRHLEHEFRAYESRAGEEKNCMFLERWLSSLPTKQRVHCPDIKHVFNGGPFGTPQVCSRFVAFVGEAADPKWPRGWWRASPATGDAPWVSAVDKFELRPNFGEKLTEAVNPQLFIWQFNGKPKIIKAPSDFVFASPAIRPGGSNAVVVVGYKVARKLAKPGISVCFNRESHLFLIEDVTLENPRVTNLTESLYLALGPTWSPDGKQLVFTGAQAAFSTHCTELSLFRLALEDQDAATATAHTLHEVKPRDSSTEFPGLHVVLHEETRQFRVLKDNKTLVFNSNCRGVGAVFKIDIFTGALCRIGSDEYSLSLLEIFSDDVLVFLKQSLATPPQLALFKHDQVSVLNLNPNDVSIANTKISVVRSAHASAFLLKNAAARDDKPLPLLVKIHGGPHACAMNAWSAEIACYLQSGFHVLLPNYRGSAGFGRGFLEALPGECGNFDVRDCHDLTLAAIAELGNSVDTEKVVAYGASHGGFITAHLLGNPEFAKTFAAGVLWNPALDLLASNLTSDIPEWSVCEVAGAQAVASAFHPGRDFLTTAYDKSAMQYAVNVKAPSLVVLGSADLRVNHMAGLRWAQYVEELGNAETAVLWYPGQGHGITGPECSDHVIVSVLAWILDRIKH